MAPDDAPPATNVLRRQQPRGRPSADCPAGPAAGAGRGPRGTPAPWRGRCRGGRAHAGSGGRRPPRQRLEPVGRQGQLRRPWSRVRGHREHRVDAGPCPRRRRRRPCGPRPPAAARAHRLPSAAPRPAGAARRDVPRPGRPRARRAAGRPSPRTGIPPDRPRSSRPSASTPSSPRWAEPAGHPVIPVVPRLEDAPVGAVRAREAPMSACSVARASRRLGRIGRRAHPARSCLDRSCHSQ